MYRENSRSADRWIKALAYVLFATSISFYILVLVGCLNTSPLLPQLFLFSIPLGSDSSMRVGNWGICIHTASGDNCLSGVTNGQELIAATFQRSGDQNFAALLSFALTMQKKIVSPGLLAAAGILLLAAIVTFAFWEIGHRARPRAKYLAFGMFCFSSILAVSFVSAQSMTMGALALYSKAIGGPHLVKGTTLQAVEIAGIALSFIATAIAVGISVAFGSSDYGGDSRGGRGQYDRY